MPLLSLIGAVVVAVSIALGVCWIFERVRISQPKTKRRK